MSEIEMKIKEKVRIIDEMSEKLIKCLDKHLDDGLADADTNEVVKVTEAINNLCCAREKCVKSMYHEEIMKAMEKASTEGEAEEPEAIKGYRGRSSTTGRYMHRPYTEDESRAMTMNRDMDRSQGKMYYTENNTGSDNMRGMTESRYDSAKRGFEESKNKNPIADNMQKMEAMFSTFEDDIEGLKPKMTVNEKTYARNRFVDMANMMM